MLYLAIAIAALYYFFVYKKTTAAGNQKVETFDELSLHMEPIGEPRSVASSRRYGLGKRASTEDAEQGIINDYVADYTKTKRAHTKAKKRERGELPYEDNVTPFNVNTLNPIPHPMELILDESQDFEPSATDNVLAGLGDLFGQSREKVRASLDETAGKLWNVVDGANDAVNYARGGRGAVPMPLGGGGGLPPAAPLGLPPAGPVVEELD